MSVPDFGRPLHAQLCEAAAPSWINDGYCDPNTDSNGFPTYNSFACGWDGGDCCETTCVESVYACETFDCLDPLASDYNGTGCAVPETSWLNDGYCDTLDESGYNTEVCGWDGGDCCYDTCEDGLYSCGVIGYYCRDPDSDWNYCTGLESKCVMR